MKPAKVSGIDDGAGESNKQCRKVAGNSGLPVQSQRGSGHNNGNYIHSSSSQGTLETANINKGNNPKLIIKAIP